MHSICGDFGWCRHFCSCCCCDSWIFRRLHFVALLLHGFLFNVKRRAYTHSIRASGILLQSIGIQVLDCCTDPFLLVSFAAFYLKEKRTFSPFFYFGWVAHVLHLIGSNVSSQITNGAYFDIIIFGILGSCMPVQIAATKQPNDAF